MFPFDIKRAEAGETVVTRAGAPVQVLSCTVKNNKYPVVAIITNPYGEDEAVFFTAEGRYYSNIDESEYDLFMEVANQPPGVYVYQTGSYNSLLEAFSNGAVYRVDTLKDPTLQTESGRTVIMDQMQVAHYAFAAAGLADDWEPRFFNGKRAYTYAELCLL